MSTPAALLAQLLALNLERAGADAAPPDASEAGDDDEPADEPKPRAKRAKKAARRKKADG
jgi:hypothetical protein